MYYAMMRSDAPGRWLGRPVFIKGLTWKAGSAITMDVPDPLPMVLKPLDLLSADHSPHLPSYFEGGTPLFRDDLVDAMQSIGVDNLQLFNVALTDPDNGATYSNYKAVNVLGLIAAADMAQSQATIHPGGPVIDVDFDRLVIDEARTRGAMIFRLAESTNALLVSARLRDFLVSRKFDDIVFHDPKDVAF